MAKTNLPRKPIYVYEGGKAAHINPELQLRRSVMACLLWEREFYEDGQDIVSRIQSLIPKVDPQKVSQIAIEAREQMKLRHMPLLITREMARLNSHKKLVRETLSRVIQRADELAEFLSIYWKDGRQPVSAQVKKGLALAFQKFDGYSLAKYNRDGVVKLRDVLFLCHAKPVKGISGYNKEARRRGVLCPNDLGSQLYKKLVDNILETPDTWEVDLSSTLGINKKEHWERLLKEDKLGGLALLRNLRNFQKEGVDESLVVERLKSMKVARILPFRFIAAARHAPQWESHIEEAMMRCLTTQEKLVGHTVLLVDVSGSMDSLISVKSEITRLDAACGVAILAREICENVDIFTFSMKLKRIPDRHGFALRDAIVSSQEHSGTPLGIAVDSIYADKSFVGSTAKFGYCGIRDVDYKGQDLNPDRLIVITDEQSHDTVHDPRGTGRGYMINMASNKNGVGYGKWIHIDGWSEAVINYIREIEKVNCH